MLVGIIQQIRQVLGVGVTKVVQVVCVFVLECKSVLLVSHVSSVLVSKMLQAVLIC